MSKLKKSAKKSQWQKLTPQEQLGAFIWGDIDVNHPAAMRLVRKVFSTRQSISEQQNPQSIIDTFERLGNKIEADKIRRDLPALIEKSKVPIGVFAKSEKGSVEYEIQELLLGLWNLFQDVSEKRSGAPLRVVADAFDAVGSHRVVDFKRLWLNIQLFEETGPPNSKLTTTPKKLTFSEVREAFLKDFPEGIEDCELRAMIKEARGVLLPEKRGRPKGGKNS